MSKLSKLGKNNHPKAIIKTPNDLVYYVDQGKKYIEGQIKEHIGNNTKLSLGMILGTGFDDITEKIKNPLKIPYQAVPGMTNAGVHNNRGHFLIGEYGQTNIPLIVQAGRIHMYEFADNNVYQPTFGVHLMAELGVNNFILTHAAGRIQDNEKGDKIEVGSLMLIKDHISTYIKSPLSGIPFAFTNVLDAYTPSYREIALRIAEKNKISLHEGVVVAVPGPHFESITEIEKFKKEGANAVGMSVVNEAIAALFHQDNKRKVNILGLSAITNLTGQEAKDAKIPPEDNHVRKVVKDMSNDIAILLDEFITEITKNNL